MDPSHRETRRNPVAELAVQVVWVVGALAAYLAGATIDPLAAVAAVAMAFGAALFLARLSSGWSAVPAMFATLMLQAPLLCGLGLYALGLPLGHHPYPCFFWYGSHLELVAALGCVVALSTPIAFMMRLDRRALHGLRWFARRAAPVVAVALAALALLGAVRLTRFPAPDRYFDSLPLHATIPRPGAQPCVPLEEKHDPKHDSGWETNTCATPDFNANPLAFHYHVDTYSNDPESKVHSLHCRTSKGHDRAVGLWFWRSEPPELPVRRDDSLGLWLVRGAGERVRPIAATGPRWSLSLREIRTRVSPPLGWSLLAGAGVLVAIACFGASSALGRLVGRGSATRQEWLADRRGDMSIIALASALCSGALLAAALIAGFLVWPTAVAW